MTIPEIVFTEQDLSELETIKSKLEKTLAAQKAMNQADAPELGEEELDLKGLDK